jgi:hypothetical protein
MPSARFEYKDFKSATLYQGSGGRRKACRRSFTKNSRNRLAISVVCVIFAPCKAKQK